MSNMLAPDRPASGPMPAEFALPGQSTASKNIVLGVTGGIAAYKAVLLLRLLREAGHQVQVVPTKAALKFVGRATWEALSGQPVHTKVFDDVVGVEHVRLGQNADLVVVAPATADFLAKAATGQADDLLTATLLTAHCPVVVAPAMHTEMWQHPATQANVATLAARGVKIIGPAIGRLTGADSGPGRMVEPGEIFAAIGPLIGVPDAAHPVGATLDAIAPDVALPVGATPDAALPTATFPDATRRKNVVITAGGTREAIDPARYISNRSTGKQGIALAESALDSGAQVTFIAANIGAHELEPLHGHAHIIQVESATELEQAVTQAAPAADVIIMAAAVADYRPAQQATAKIKKADGQPLTIELVENPDVLAELCRNRKPGQVIVGFAAETGDANGTVLDHGRTKALRKGADLLAVNEVGAAKGFGTATNEVWLLDSAGEQVGHASGSKRQVADAIIAAVTALLPASGGVVR